MYSGIHFPVIMASLIILIGHVSLTALTFLMFMRISHVTRNQQSLLVTKILKINVNHEFEENCPCRNEEFLYSKERSHISNDDLSAVVRKESENQTLLKLCHTGYN